jgi:hypothetical protein
VKLLDRLVTLTFFFGFTLSAINFVLYISDRESLHGGIIQYRLGVLGLWLVAGSIVVHILSHTERRD